MSWPVDSSLSALVPLPGRDERDADDGPVLRIDGFLEPRHLVGVAAVAHRLSLTTARPGALVVTDPECAGYAARMHLDRALTARGWAHELVPVRERRLGDRLLEVTEVVDPDQVRSLGALVRRRLRGRERDRETVTALYDAVTELGINVYVHADPGVRHRTTGYAAAQTMTRTDEIVFAIADYGVGMLGTLESRGATDDHEAIRMGLDGTSRFPGPTGGLGLRTTAQLVTALGGSLYLASGTVSVRVRSGRRRWAQLATPYRGTLLQARVPMA